MKKIALGLSFLAILLMGNLKAEPSSLKADIKAAFQKASSSDYKGMSTLVKKYTDATSIKAMLTAKNPNGQTLLHIAANSSNTTTATKMAISILNQALTASSQLQKSVIEVKDKQNKTPLDYAKNKNNTTLVSLFNSVISVAKTRAQSSAAGATTGIMSTTGATTSSTPGTTTETPLQADIDAAFKKAIAGDYMGMSKLVKKYTDVASIQAMLTAVQNGKTLLHIAASADDATAVMMAGRITGQASLVSPQFQLQVITAKDSQGKTPVDYATSKGNTSFVDVLNQLSASLSSQ